MRLTKEQLKRLKKQYHVVVEDFLTPTVQQQLLEDVERVRASKHHGRFVKINIKRNECPIHFETCTLLSDMGKILSDFPPNKERQEIYRVLNRLRMDIAKQNRLDLEHRVTELIYGYYPPTGQMGRHFDWCPEGDGQDRMFCIMIFLSTPETSGGLLRLYLPTGETLEVPPVAGTLVVLHCPSVAYEVVQTTSERYSIEAWLHKPLTDQRKEEIWASMTETEKREFFEALRDPSRRRRYEGDLRIDTVGT